MDIAPKLDALTAIAGDTTAQPVLRERAQALRERFTQLNTGKDASGEDYGQLLDALHQFQRLNYMHRAKASAETIAALDAVGEKEKSWSELPALAVDPALPEQLAGRLMHSTFQHQAGGEYLPFKEQPPLNRDKTLLQISPEARGAAEPIIGYMLRHDIPFDVDFADNRFKRILFKAASKEQMAGMAAFNATRYSSDVKNRISVVSDAPKEEMPEEKTDEDKEKMKIFSAPQKALRQRLAKGDGFYTLTIIPTPHDAKLDDIPYPDYLKLFFESCDQPWAAIHKANAHLIDKLEKAKNVHIVDEETGTDLTFSIDGKRWANSLILKNIPGAEVFASPVRDSINGKLVAKGKFQYDDSGIIRNMTLTFKNGRVVDFDAAEGKDALKKIIEADDGKGEGSRHVGEFAMGTNPWLKKHMVNGLLVEKIGHSFHFALGESYHYKEYDGKAVNLDNGNTSESGTHWDITTMMDKTKSRIVLDEGTPQEYVVLKDGKFPDPALKVLNDGWAAIPLQERPNYWQQRLAQPDATARTI